MYKYIFIGAFGLLLFLGFLLIRWRNRPNKEFIIYENKICKYDYKPRILQVPVSRGIFLKLLCRLVNSIFGKLFLIDILTSQGDLDVFRSVKFNNEYPTFYPVMPFTEEAAKPNETNILNEDIENILHTDNKIGEFSHHSISSYLLRYKNGQTPSEVAEKVIIGIEETKYLKAVIKFDLKEIRKMAAESSERYKSNTTLSPVDGVFVIIKDEYSLKGFHYSKGTSFLGMHEVAGTDSALVARLKQLGVIIIGISNMHELGIGTTGNNPNKRFGTCRNPYNPSHYTGGSSSGSASAVAAGLCCMGLGTDGGGSIRIPSSYCGVVGLKPTFGRMNLAGVTGLSNTVGHAGTICSNVRDTAVFYLLLAGPHPDYMLGLSQPQLKLPDFNGDLKGFRIAIDSRYFKDCTEDVKSVCTDSLQKLKKCGAQLDEIQIPELQNVVVAHRIAILSEMTTTINHDFDVNFEKITLASRILFRVGDSLRATDYIQANKQRTRIIHFLKDLFAVRGYDAIVTPTTGHCAPEIVKSELDYGMLNATQDSYNMRYAGLANFSGCPAITLPVGYNDAGLPVGLQFMSAWWKEDIILKIAECVEREVKLRKPKIFTDILQH